MTIRIKALTAVLLIALAPAASAQSFGIGHTGPGSWQHGIIGAPIDHGGWTPAPVIGAPVQAQGCGAAHAQILVGRSIHNTPVPGNARVIGPGTVVTYDYRTDRLNIAHDNNGTITGVYCG